MKILTVHGLGGQEKNPETWQPEWKRAIEQAFARWGSQRPKVEHANYDEVFGATPMTAGGTAEGFGKLLWDEIKFGVLDTVSHLWPFRRRGFAADVSEAVKWKIGMVTQFAENENLRARLRDHLAKQMRTHKPDIVFAHSLGTLLTYSLLLNKDYKGLLHACTYITAGCQIGRAALRTLFGGRLNTVDVRSWFNLYNRNDDVLVVPLNIFAPNYRQIDTHFELAGVGDHDAISYILHENAINTVWRHLATKPSAPARAIGGAKPKATKADILPLLPSAPAPPRLDRRALLIGIDDYPSPDDRLEGCVNDVFKMSAALQQVGFKAEEIRVVFNERATSAGIRERFSWLLEDPQAGDVRVLYFSGHGAQIPDYASDETVDHKDETLVAYDFDWSDRSTYLTDDDFNAVYAQLPYDMTFIAFFDCCHSGGIARMGGAKVRGLSPPDDIRHRMLRWNPRDQVWEPRDLGERRRTRKIDSYMNNRSEYVGEEKDTNRILRGVQLRQIDSDTYKRRKEKFNHLGPYQPLLFEACKETEFAYEYRDGVTSYGAYTFFLTQRLFSAFARQSDSTFAELHESAKKLVGEYFDQTPQIVGPKAQRRTKVPRPTSSKKSASRRKTQ